MPTKVRHYKDKRTGRYVTKRRWQNAKKRGDNNIVRVQERYTKPTKRRRLPKPIPPIPPGGPGRVIERLKYQGQDRKKYDLEIVTENGKVKSVRVNRYRYDRRADFHKLADLIEAARGEALEDTEDED